MHIHTIDMQLKKQKSKEQRRDWRPSQKTGLESQAILNEANTSLKANWDSKFYFCQSHQSCKRRGLTKYPLAKENAKLQFLLLLLDICIITLKEYRQTFQMEGMKALVACLCFEKQK